MNNESVNSDLEMKRELLNLANKVREAVLPRLNYDPQQILRREDGGDPHFMVDELAEQTVERVLKTWTIPVALFSEDRGLILYHKNPQWILIIDPIDGTRPAIANFESCCFSAAVAPYSSNPKFGEISHALVLELKSGNYFYADNSHPRILASLPSFSLTSSFLTKKTDPERMFWSTELTAHPIKHLARVCGDLIDGSVTLGAIFVFTSSSYSLTRIVTGQLDAHVDVGHRILQDYPETEKDFLKVGRGKFVTLFPYDIAAAAFILKKAGGVVTDAYGNSLANLSLKTDKSISGQCSIIAASNPELHTNIMNKLNW
ncbi:MAG: inositol monophosphatase family protein [Candidatus Woesearchaeota archaeon]